MSSKSRTRFFKTLGFKIALWYSLTVLLILLIIGGFLYYRLKHSLIKETDNILFDVSEDVVQTILAHDYSTSDLLKSMRIESSSQRYLRVTMRLYDTEQNTFIDPGNFITPNLRISDDEITKAVKGESTLKTIRVEGASAPYRLITRYVETDDHKYILQVGIYMKLPYKTVENMQENFLMSMPILILFSIVGGWFISKKSLHPIENITEETQKITSSNLDKRLVSTRTGDELDNLIHTINLMLDRIEESFVRIAQFTSDVSHELRTPVAALKTGTEVTLSKERTSEEYRELLENNLSSLERMSRMISDLLELSMSDSGTNILHLKSFNLSNMLNDLQNKFKPVSDSKGIRLSFNGLPDININGDETLLRRVFANLLDNATKYTSKGGRISLSLKDRENDVIARISDTGIGISKKNLGKIFDRFFRVDPSRSREAGGSGLGLNISKNIVELHKGRIEVESEPGEGSTFQVILPKNL